MEKKLIIDLHNHITLLPNWLNRVAHKVLKNDNSLDYIFDELEKRHSKLIIGVALYSLPWVSDNKTDIQNQIDYLKSLELKDFKGKKLKIIKSFEDFESDFDLGITLSLESTRWFYGDLNFFDWLRGEGVCGIIPVHYKNNWFGGSCDHPIDKLFSKPNYKGLSDIGKKSLDKMKELGIWLDVTHMNDITLKESLDNFHGFVMASHVGVRDLINVKRNLSRESVELVAKKEGIFGICAWSRITGQDVDDIKSIIEYFKSGVGIDKLAIGSDFGPPITTPRGVGSIFDLVDKIALSSPDESDKIMYENSLIFFKRYLSNEI